MRTETQEGNRQSTKGDRGGQVTGLGTEQKDGGEELKEGEEAPHGSGKMKSSSFGKSRCRGLVPERDIRPTFHAR